MWQFIISGYVPGTDIQIGFDIIMSFFVLVFVCLLGFVLFRYRKMIKRDIESALERLEHLREISL